MPAETVNHNRELTLIDDHSIHTVTSLLATKSPTIKSGKDAAEILFSKPLPFLRSQVNFEINEHEITEEELNFAANFGRFPSRPSDLFLKLFYNVLCTLKRDPLCGVVSPSLIGTSGVIPLTIISTIPDIMQHYYHCIVHAKNEVLFATNYWEKGHSVSIIGQALKDLSKIAQDENRFIVFKLMIDHPTKENITHFHSILPPNKWSHYDIPTPDQIPNISLEIVNYHRIIMGTFHSKFLIIDRRIALLNSNNIQDRPNLEMMAHFEGDIVNSLYDTFIISWWIPFQPDLICLNDERSSENDFEFGMNYSKIVPFKESLEAAVARARSRLQRHLDNEEAEIYFNEPLLSSSESPLTHHLNLACEPVHKAATDKNLSNDDLQKRAQDFKPYIYHEPHQPFPIALVNRAPHGTPGHTDTANPQDAAWLGAFRYAQKSIFIQSPTLNAKPAIDGILSACRRGIQVILWLDLGFNDLKEGHGTFQGGTNEHIIKKLYKKLEKEKNGSEQFLEVYWYTGKGLFENIFEKRFLFKKF
jgi:phosphatidylserine/phosphatidylglycerophosphate/cardiolipin synthase-like enzyme